MSVIRRHLHFPDSSPACLGRLLHVGARLVVERILDLEREGARPKKIETAVRSTPPDLNKLYRQLIENMGPAARKLVEWICFATRPLTLDELRWAMVIETDTCPYRSLKACQDAEEYVPDNDSMERQVQTLSRGLAEVTRTMPYVRKFRRGIPKVKRVSPGPVVQFIHQSVKDFFMEEGLLVLSGGCYETSTGVTFKAHLRLGNICLRYLSMEEIGRARSYMASEFPLLPYTTTSWVAHMKQCDAAGSVPHDEILDLLGWPSNTLVEFWADVYQVPSMTRFSKMADAPLTWSTSRRDMGCPSY